MGKTLIFALLLIGAATLQALEGHPGWSADQKSESAPTTIQGCLQSAAGHFSLTESNGTVHQLAFSKKLIHFDGHEVTITGKPSVRTVSETSYGAASSAEEFPIFEVKTVTQLAD